MKRKVMIIVIIALLTLIIGFFFLKPAGKDSNASATGEIKEFSITAKQFDFEPDTIRVNKGDLVKISIESVDVEHGIRISEFNVNKNLKPGETVDIEFVADKIGEFDFFCNVYCGDGHREMKGRLIVN